MLENILIILGIIASYYLSLFTFIWFFILIFKTAFFSLPLSVYLDKIGLINKKKKMNFYFKEFAIFAVPIFSSILISYAYIIKNIHPGIKIASFVALPYSLYLAYIYVFSSETFCKTVKDYFNFNAEYIQSEALLNNVKKDNLAEELNNFKGGTPNNRIRKYIRKNK